MSSPERRRATTAGTTLPAIRVESVAWLDLDAVALREAMTMEGRQRYADRFTSPSWVEAPAMAVVDGTAVYTCVAYAGTVPVGHAALRPLEADLELKRMYVRPEHRGTGVAQALLEAVEAFADETGAPRIVLQTGDRQPEAVRVYEKAGYHRIPLLPIYQHLTYSNCFAKNFRADPDDYS